MRTVKWNAFLSCLCGVAVVLGGMAVSARADVTTEKGASILIFPKVRADGTFDTVIQITNTSNSMVHARCFYVNASLQDLITTLPCTIPSRTCVPQWQETDFNIWLTKQQPTHWIVSEGRNFNPTAEFGSNDAGFAPGAVPPMSSFIGELKCIQVTESGEPITSNSLKGEATLVSVATITAPLGTFSSDETVRGDVAKYNAVGIVGNPNAPAPTNPLLLDGFEGDPNDETTNFSACPSKLIVNHFASGASDLVADEVLSGSTSSEFTDLTLVPCNEDFENQAPTAVTVQFVVFNEFEQRFSASTTVNCFLEIELARIDSQFSGTNNVNSSVFGFRVLGSNVAQTVITPVVQPNGASGGLVGIAERITSVEFDESKTAARAAYNLHSEGSFIPPNGPDEIRMPAQE